MPLLAPLIHIMGFFFPAPVHWERHLLSALYHSSTMKQSAFSSFVHIPFPPSHQCPNFNCLLADTWIKIFLEFSENPLADLNICLYLRLSLSLSGPILIACLKRCHWMHVPVAHKHLLMECIESTNNAFTLCYLKDLDSMYSMLLTEGARSGTHDCLG